MLDLPYERPSIEWRPITGFENQYEVSNYGDFHILPYEFIDKANRKITRKEKYIWSEDLSEYGGNSQQGKYLGIHLGGMEKTYAHILAAKEFCENPNNKPEVNHKNGNTKYNYCGCKENDYKDSNLEWVTRKENMEHASENGLINHESYLRKLQCKINRERVNYDALKKSIVQLTKNGEYVKEYSSISEASKTTGIKFNTISSVLRNDGYHKSAGGYNWIYKDEYSPDKDYALIIDQGSGNRKRVGKYSLQGDFIDSYNSIKEAAIENNFPIKNYIGDVCNNKRLSYKGFKWKFID